MLNPRCMTRRARRADRRPTHAADVSSSNEAMNEHGPRVFRFADRSQSGSTAIVTMSLSHRPLAAMATYTRAKACAGPRSASRTHPPRRGGRARRWAPAGARSQRSQSGGRGRRGGHAVYPGQLNRKAASNTWVGWKTKSLLRPSPPDGYPRCAVESRTAPERPGRRAPRRSRCQGPRARCDRGKAG